jgi:SRSO17 transposase
MTPYALKKLDRELSGFVAEMTDGMGRPERRAAMGHYITGLLLDGERKSVQPMAARLVDDPAEADAMRQRLADCVTSSPWADAELQRRLALKLARELPGIEVFIFDDTGFPKKGSLSVGVHRQYSGTLGRTENCQVATSLHVAGEKGSGCIGLRLYLPEAWTCEPERCRKAGVPDDIEFKKKWELALELLDQALAWGLEKKTVLADSGYGEVTEFRDELVERGLRYVVGVPGNHLVWPPGADPRVPKRTGKAGRPRTQCRDADVQPIQIAKLVEGIPRNRYKTVSWRPGSRGHISSKFLFYRVRSAERHTKGRPPGEEQWLIAEWPESEKGPKFHFSNLPASITTKELVRTTKLRWRVERDYQEMKGELGLDHFEGRTWRGFHHHATLCAVAHGFLALRRALFPPEQSEMDSADGAPPSAADPADAHRLVSPVRKTGRPALAAKGGFALMTMGDAP